MDVQFAFLPAFEQFEIGFPPRYLFLIGRQTPMTPASVKALAVSNRMLKRWRVPASSQQEFLLQTQINSRVGPTRAQGFPAEAPEMLTDWNKAMTVKRSNDFITCFLGLAAECGTTARRDGS